MDPPPNSGVQTLYGTSPRDDTELCARPLGGGLGVLADHGAPLLQAAGLRHGGLRGRTVRQAAGALFSAVLRFKIFHISHVLSLEFFVQKLSVTWTSDTVTQ